MFRFSGFVACSGQETFGSDVRQTRRITWIAVAVARAAGSASPGAWRCVLVAGSFPSDAAVCQDRMVPPPAFVLTQKTLMLVSDLITSALLFGQYSIGRLHAFNILAGG